ncbi:MAG TPA: SPOR domain-containing protein [Bryobacteraceae bacterium]|nr:SPOR domain-containing protein [Bryobacteraceae bacterium]
MAKNEDGEFELILGNRQLISVFLIVVILLGVFFSMGYIVGRNSAPAASESVPSKATAARSPQSSDSAPSNSDAAKTSEPPPPAAEPTSEAREQSGTHPVKESASDERPAARPSQPAPVQKPKASPLPAPAPVAPAAAPANGDPVPGLYWQVVATARPDAEIISEALTKKGFHAILAPAPRDGVFRVLVGPLKDAATQAQTRTSLEAAGFKNPIVRKY